MSAPAPLDGEPSLQPTGPPEFDDEPPGAVLFELRPRAYLIAWGAVELAAVAAAAAVALSTPARWMQAWRLPLAIVWFSLPASAILGLVLTGFTRLNLPANAGPSAIARWAAVLHLAALAAWAALRWGAGVVY